MLLCFKAHVHCQELIIVKYKETLLKYQENYVNFYHQNIYWMLNSVPPMRLSFMCIILFNPYTISKK